MLNHHKRDILGWNSEQYRKCVWNRNQQLQAWQGMRECQLICLLAIPNHADTIKTTCIRSSRYSKSIHRDSWGGLGVLKSMKLKDGIYGSIVNWVRNHQVYTIWASNFDLKLAQYKQLKSKKKKSIWGFAQKRFISTEWIRYGHVRQSQLSRRILNND